MADERRYILSDGITIAHRSMSLTEKDFSGGEDSQDEDSGHDSTDSLKDVPVDDRERIVHLETAVAWIREEMVSRVYPMVDLGL